MAAAVVIASLLALGDSLENIQLFTVQLLHTLAGDLGRVVRALSAYVLKDGMKVNCTVMAARREGLVLQPRL